MTALLVLGVIGILVFIIAVCYREGITDFARRMSARAEEPECGCSNWEAARGHRPEPIHCPLHVADTELWAAFERDYASRDEAGAP